MVAITAFPTTAFPASVATPSRGYAPAARADLRVVPAGGRARTGAAGRTLLAVLVSLVVVAAVAHLVLADPLPAAGEIPVQEAGHVVAPGGTMWSIATEVAPAGEAATYVERLVAATGGAAVDPGQVLALPVP